MISDMRDYIKKYYGLILLSVIAAVLCYGVQAMNTNIRIDTEELLNEPGTTLGWLTIGRYGLVLLKRILGLSAHSALKSGLFFLLFFTAGANLLTFAFYHLSGRNKKYPYWIFLLLYSTSSIWSYQVYFSLQQAEIALAMLLIIIAALLSVRACFMATEKMTLLTVRSCHVSVRKRNILRFAAATVFLVIGFGAYQALAPYYIVICIAFFLTWYLTQAETERQGGVKNSGSPHKKLFGGIVCLLLQFGAAYLLYSLIAGTWFMAAGEYMQDQAAWGRLSVLECIKNILRTGKHVLLANGPRNFSFYTAGVLLAAAAVLLVWKQKLLKQKMQAAVFLLAMAGLLASPFLMTVYTGEMLVTRTQFALPVAAAFLAMYSIYILLEYGRKKEKPGILCNILILTVVLVQMGYNWHLAYADWVRYKHDAALTKQMTDALIEAGDGMIPELPVLFVGYRKPELNVWSRRSEMYGWSFYEWDYNVGQPAGASHRIAGFIQAYGGIRLSEAYSEEMKEKAAVLSRDMPVFPESGSIYVADDFVVIKLSAISERSDVDWW